MAIFGPKRWVNPFGKMSIFRLFELLVFIAQKGVFSFQNIIKDILLAYITKKKKVEKWPFLDQNHRLTLLEKCQFFLVFQLVLFIAQKGVFSFQNIVKDIFLGYIGLKKKVAKMASLEPKPLVNPFGKMSNFRRFELLVFIAQKDVFLFQNMVKDISLTILPDKKKMEKLPFLDQNHGITPLEKCQLFELLNFLFLQPRKAFFRSRIS